MSIKLLLLFLHLICAAGWLGCILVEVVCERTIQPGETLAHLHWRADKYIEIPLFTGVFLSGGALISMSTITPLLLVKIGCGLLAILFNIVCMRIVRQRLDAARAGDRARYAKLDHLQHRIGGGVLLGVLVALGIGGYLFAQGML